MADRYAPDSPYPSFLVKDLRPDFITAVSSQRCPVCDHLTGRSAGYMICSHCQVQWDPLGRGE